MCVCVCVCVCMSAECHDFPALNNVQRRELVFFVCFCFTGHDAV